MVFLLLHNTAVNHNAPFQLTDVVVKEHDPETSTMKVVSADLKTLLEKDPMGFSYQDGNIEQLCLASDQDVKVLNIKRGILSMFQNNMDDIKQTQTVKEVYISHYLPTK